jgi:hypothetical protein
VLNLPPGSQTFTITAVGVMGGTATKSVTVNVVDPFCTLTTSANPAEGGTVSGGGTYPNGQTATVSATPTGVYRFVGWSGDVTGTANPLNVLMSGNRNVIALFTARNGQAISFPNPGPREVGVTFALQATASSGLPVAYTIIAGPANLTLSSMLTPTGQGNITVRASQTGDSNWAPAAPVDVTFNAYPPAKVTFKEDASETNMENSKTHGSPNKVVSGP